MRKNNMLDSLNKLKEKDIYSTMLYCLYKLNNDDKYSTISSLMWVLDKENLFNFLTIFGGVEMRVPTIYEMRVVAYALLVYQYIDIDNTCNTTEDALNNINIDNVSRNEIIDAYFSLRDIINREGLPNV